MAMFMFSLLFTLNIVHQVAAEDDDVTTTTPPSRPKCILDFQFRDKLGLVERPVSNMDEMIAILCLCYSYTRDAIGEVRLAAVNADGGEVSTKPVINREYTNITWVKVSKDLKNGLDKYQCLTENVEIKSVFKPGGYVVCTSEQAWQHCDSGLFGDGSTPICVVLLKEDNVYCDSGEVPVLDDACSLTETNTHRACPRDLSSSDPITVCEMLRKNKVNEYYLIGWEDISDTCSEQILDITLMSESNVPLSSMKLFVIDLNETPAPQFTWNSRKTVVITKETLEKFYCTHSATCALYDNGTVTLRLNEDKLEPTVAEPILMWPVTMMLNNQVDIVKYNYLRYFLDFLVYDSSQLSLNVTVTSAQSKLVNCNAAVLVNGEKVTNASGLNGARLRICLNKKGHNPSVNDSCNYFNTSYNDTMQLQGEDNTEYVCTASLVHRHSVGTVYQSVLLNKSSYLSIIPPPTPTPAPPATRTVYIEIPADAIYDSEELARWDRNFLIVFIGIWPAFSLLMAAIIIPLWINGYFGDM